MSEYDCCQSKQVAKTKTSWHSLSVVNQNKWQRPRAHDRVFPLSVKTSGKDQELMTEPVCCQSKQVEKTKSSWQSLSCQSKQVAKTKSSWKSLSVVSQNKWQRPRAHDRVCLFSVKTSGTDQKFTTESISCQSKQVAKTKSTWQSLSVVSQNKWQRPRIHDRVYQLSVKTSGKDQELMTESVKTSGNDQEFMTEPIRHQLLAKTH